MVSSSSQWKSILTHKIIHKMKRINTNPQSPSKQKHTPIIRKKYHPHTLVLCRLPNVFETITYPSWRDIHHSIFTSQKSKRYQLGSDQPLQEFIWNHSNIPDNKYYMGRHSKYHLILCKRDINRWCSSGYIRRASYGTNKEPYFLKQSGSNQGCIIRVSVKTKQP